MRMVVRGKFKNTEKLYFSSVPILFPINYKAGVIYFGIQYQVNILSILISSEVIGLHNSKNSSYFPVHCVFSNDNLRR